MAGTTRTAQPGQAGTARGELGKSLCGLAALLIWILKRCSENNTFHSEELITYSTNGVLQSCRGSARKTEASLLRRGGGAHSGVPELYCMSFSGSCRTDQQLPGWEFAVRHITFTW